MSKKKITHPERSMEELMSTGIYERQMAFEVEAVHRDGEEITLKGTCYLYDESAPAYQIVLSDESTGEELTAKTDLDGNTFIATAAVRSDADYELKVLFKHHDAVSTKCYVHGEQIAYVPARVPKPKEVDDLVHGALLKAYNPDYEVYVYQYPDKMLWLIGKEIPENTEIIYHLYTNEPEKLPEARWKYQSDNLGFMVDNVGGKQAGRYRAFEAPLPTEYPITAIGVGYSTHGIVSWKEYFRPSKQSNYQLIE